MGKSKPYFSIIVPVYNRINEINDLLESLTHQTDSDFEIIIIEDGSTEKCEITARNFSDRINIQYYYKENEGRSIARNYGIIRANGDYLVFVDSDCIFPNDYIRNLKKNLSDNPTDCFGGPDAAHESFSDLQKAINYSMTSFLTTGGIRGGKIQLEKFVPRTFNMGFSKKVFDTVGGFREMFSEDIDMSTRIRQAGFSISLFRDVEIYHKRRISLKKFWRQVHVFGMSRITLKLLYPDSLKIVHTLPALFVVFASIMLLASFVKWWISIPLIAYITIVWISGIISTKSLKIGSLAIITSLIQLIGYGTGFIRAFTWKILLGHGRDEAQEIEIRRGK